MPQDLSAVPWPVRTDRLTIRPATVDDLPLLFEIRRRPEVSQWLPTLPTDRDAFVERLGDPELLAVTLVLEMGGELIGDLYLSIGHPWAQAEVADRARGTQASLGWVVAPEHAGRGIATEAAAELMRICFEDLGLRRVTAECFADNVASWRVMERLGMRREEHAVRDSLHRSGEWLDGVRYALLAEEWTPRQGTRRRAT